MKFLTSLIFIFSVFAANAWAEDALIVPEIPSNEQELDKFIKALKGQTLPQLEALLSCTKSTEIVTKEYKDLKDLLPKKGQKEKLITRRKMGESRQKYNMNILDNFDAVKKSQEIVWIELDSFANILDRLPPEDLETASMRKRDLESDYKKLINRLVVLSTEELNFLHFITCHENKVKGL